MYPYLSTSSIIMMYLVNLYHELLFYNFDLIACNALFRL